MADPSESAGAPTHIHGLPNPHRLGFVPGHLLRHGRYDFTATAAAVAARLGRPVTLVDELGFHDEIVAGALDAGGDRVAWLRCRSKKRGQWVDIGFTLHATAGGKAFVEWTPRTYNPYFGINPLAFDWFGDDLVFIYSEKHHVYRAEFDAAGRLTLGRWCGGQFLPPEEAERRRRQAFRARREFEKRKWSIDIPHERLIVAILGVLFIAAIIVVFFVLPG
jgi:hypothetical protein